MKRAFFSFFNAGNKFLITQGFSWQYPIWGLIGMLLYFGHLLL